LVEIGAACGITSVGTVHRYVAQIEEKGYLERARKGWRTLVAPNSLPFCGDIAAGHPLEAIEQAESVDLMSLLVQPDCFLLRIKGDSMIDAGIFENDLVVIQKSNTARNGQIVVALIADSDASLKEIHNLRNGTVELIPHNKNLETLTFPSDQVRIQGVLRSVIRTY
jgi:repressor LexA